VGHVSIRQVALARIQKMAASWRPFLFVWKLANRVELGAVIPQKARPLGRAEVQGLDTLAAVLSKTGASYYRPLGCRYAARSE
jgi:hypothetical protein